MRLNGLTEILTLTCERAAHLMSDSLDRRLLLSERIALLGHLLACRLCRKFRRQLKTMHASIQQHATSQPPLPHSPARLSSSSRDRIEEAIARAIHQEKR